MEGFISEVRMFAFDFAPVGYANCDGQTITITDNPSLYSLIGTTFGGNGTTNFKLPDLRGRVPIHRGADFPYAGIYYGQERHVLTWHEIPQHTHILNAVQNPENTSMMPKPNGGLCENSANDNKAFIESTDQPNALLSPDTCSSAGSGQSHNNMMPSTVINFSMALEGQYPTRN
jgi:microcystin-dependent protein